MNIFKSFLKGMSFLFNPKINNLYKNKTDAEAIKSDWEQVGKDMLRAINQFEKENKI